MLPVATLNWLESRYIADRPLGDQIIVPNCRPLRRRWSTDVPCCVGATEASWVGAWGRLERSARPDASCCYVFQAAEAAPADSGGSQPALSPSACLSLAEKLL